MFPNMTCKTPELSFTTELVSRWYHPHGIKREISAILKRKTELLISSLRKLILSKARSQRTGLFCLFKGKAIEALNHVIFNLKKIFLTCYCMFHKPRKQSDQVEVYKTRQYLSLRQVGIQVIYSFAAQW